MRLCPQHLLLICTALAVGIAHRNLLAEESPDITPVQSFIKAHCADCHGGENAEAELSLTEFTDMQTMVQKRKVWTNVLRMVSGGEMPPVDQEQPPPGEVDKFMSAVESIFNYHDAHAPPDPGRVTMRRLNRVEYRNTIRDLIGVDFDPTEGFPADDVGNGFDNIGDVLTVSPILMERYLAAAESITQRAIMPNPPSPPDRRLSARYSEPASGDVEKKLLVGGFRVVSSDSTEAIEVGPLNTPYQWQDDGEYIFRTRVYGSGTSANPIRVAILVHGPELSSPSNEDELANLVGNVLKPARLINTFDVRGNTPETAEVLEVQLPAMTGRHRVLVALLKPVDGNPPAKLFVEYFALRGPLDTRPASQRRLLACTAEKSPAEKTREVLTRFLRLAYRRPATPEEIERVATLVDSSIEAGQSWEAGMQFAIQAVLCSPKFLFRAELDDRPHDPQARQLDEFALASRLSYFLWSTMPDEELLSLAEQKQLTAQLKTQVQRMLADPKAETLVEEFGMQWLQLKRIATFAPDATLFPSFDEQLRRSMVKETEMFLTSIVQEDRSIYDLITANYTFLDERLAKHYGIVDTEGNIAGQQPEEPRGDAIRGPEFRRVTLKSGLRGGLISQASVLTVTSNPTRTSPVKRGRWVLEQILGAPPPPPPPNVPELPANGEANTVGSLRERMKIHRENPACANCHAKMDPIGFALENYDAIGAFRQKDGDFDIDASGEFPDGTSFQGPMDLKAVIGNRKQEFTRCIAEKLLTFALGRGLEHYDVRAVNEIVKNTMAADGKFSDLVLEIVRSDPFQQRRGIPQ